MSYTLHVLQDGYSYLLPDGSMKANGTSTLLHNSTHNIIIDTLGPWDAEKLQQLLAQQSLTPEDITHVICTHGHPDHTGNNNLFLNAKCHIVGRSVYQQDVYYPHPFDEDIPYVIDEFVSVIPTSGHTHDSVSVLVKGCLVGDVKCGVVVVGDLFEKEEDINDARIWKDAGSEDELCQIEQRRRVVELEGVEYVVPGHGPMFRVTEKMRIVLKEESEKIQ